ncbi:MAG: c-type cytochrome [Acidobacteriota bacterium]
MMRSMGCAAVACLVVCFALTACTGGKAKGSYSVGDLGDAHAGKQLIRSYGCGACHIIPGVNGARGLVGPPLYYFADRTMIAGELANTPPNLTRWIEHPKQVEPNTAMPDLGVTADQAKDIAAYLYTLRGREGAPWTE